MSNVWVDWKTDTEASLIFGATFIGKTVMQATTVRDYAKSHEFCKQ